MQRQELNAALSSIRLPKINCLTFLVASLSAPILGATGTGHSSGHAESWQDPAHQDNVSDKNYDEP
jgi:hypothetical protein